MAGRKVTSRRHIDVRERQGKALELRKAGATYAQIAEAVGYAHEQSAYKAVRKAMQAIVQEPSEELALLQQERLNHMLVILWPRIQGGEDTAINTALRVMERMDRLAGLDSGTGNLTINSQSNVVIVDGNSEEYIEGLKKMVQARIPQRPPLEAPSEDPGVEDAIIVEET